MTGIGVIFVVGASSEIWARHSVLRLCLQNVEDFGDRQRMSRRLVDDSAPQ
jgi:hypothetical protein